MIRVVVGVGFKKMDGWMLGIGVRLGVDVDNGFVEIGVSELVGNEVGFTKGGGHVLRLLYVGIVQIDHMFPPSEFSPIEVLYPNVLG